MVTNSLLWFAAGLSLIINSAVFLLFAADKQKARAGAGRTPEKALLFWAVFGPFGAFFAMRFFRHKTQKRKFLLVPLFGILQIAAILCLAITGP